MRSDDWDDDEREFEKKHGFTERDGKEHEHNFDPITHRCAICLKTREQIRKEW